MNNDNTAPKEINELLNSHHNTESIWAYYDCDKCGKRHWSADKNPLNEYGQFKYCKACYFETIGYYESKTAKYLSSPVSIHGIVIRLLIAACVVIAACIVVKNATA